LPKQWGVQLPFYVGYSSTISNPIFDPYDLDVKFADKLNRASSSAQRDSIKNAALELWVIRRNKENLFRH
jgi:cell surface protein SprA